MKNKNLEKFEPKPIEGIEDILDNALWYMERLMRGAGFNPEKVPDWEKAVRISNADLKKHASKNKPEVYIKSRTLYLRVNFDYQTDSILEVRSKGLRAPDKSRFRNAARS